MVTEGMAEMEEMVETEETEGETESEARGGGANINQEQLGANM